MINKIYKIVDGIIYNRHIPKKAEELAKDNNFIVIVGGSDDLFYAYGAKSYLTEMQEHGYGWDGNDLKNISDKKLEFEANQLGLKIFWCGSILDTGEEILDYDVEKQGAFSYKVKDNIEFKNFTIYEDNKKDDIYCTGIIIKLPENFKKAKNNEHN